MAKDYTERERCIHIVTIALDGEHPIYTRTDYGSGLTDYVRVYVAHNDRSIQDLTYHVATAAELKLNERGIKMGGGQYSKGLEVFGWACKVAGVPEDQSRWQELH
jgi:hypothetical protein